MTLSASEAATASKFEIYDDANGKKVGRIERTRVDNFQWDIDGCGSFADTLDEALAAAQHEYDKQQHSAKLTAEKAALEAQAAADSGDRVADLMSSLKRLSEEMTAEYYRKVRRPASIASHEAELDKIKTELSVTPIRFRGYSIKPVGDMWIVTSPVSASYTWEFASLAGALAYVNTTLAEPF